jgi:hypothetical protein
MSKNKKYSSEPIKIEDILIRIDRDIIRFFIDSSLVKKYTTEKLLKMCEYLSSEGYLSNTEYGLSMVYDLGGFACSYDNEKNVIHMMSGDDRGLKNKSYRVNMLNYAIQFLQENNIIDSPIAGFKFHLIK